MDHLRRPLKRTFHLLIPPDISCANDTAAELKLDRRTERALNCARLGSFSPTEPKTSSDPPLINAERLDKINLILQVN